MILHLVYEQLIKKRGIRLISLLSGLMIFMSVPEHSELSDAQAKSNTVLEVLV